MKNIKFIIVLSVLFLAVSSCKEETPLSIQCTICGVYTGTVSGNLEIPLTGTNETFTDLATTVNVTLVSFESSTYNIALDLSAMLGSPQETLVPNFDAMLSNNGLTISNETYPYQGPQSILINGLMTFSDSNFGNGTFIFSGDAIATINFSGSK